MILAEARPHSLLLDTCAMIYLFNGEAILDETVEAIDNAVSVWVSPISAWEIGILGRKQNRNALEFLPTPTAWFRGALAYPCVVEAPFDAEIALASCDLPEPLHRDPADRFLIATARRLSVPIVTRDRLILAYARQGHIDAIAC